MRLEEDLEAPFFQAGMSDTDVKLAAQRLEALRDSTSRLVAFLMLRRSRDRVGDVGDVSIGSSKTLGRGRDGQDTKF